MKKIILKVLNWIAYYGACASLGVLLSKIANWLLFKIGVNEESAEAHPWRTIILWLLVLLFVMILPAIGLIVFVLVPIQTILNEKIDDMDDDPFED